MALAAQLTIAGDSSTTRVYEDVGRADRKTTRKDSTLGVDQPFFLTITHSEESNKGVISDRHLVRFDRTVVDSEDNAATVSFYGVFSVPRKIITLTHVQDLVTQFKNLLTSGNVAKIVNGES